MRYLDENWLSKSHGAKVYQRRMEQIGGQLKIGSDKTGILNIKEGTSIDKDFMTSDEITHMYSLLKGHMLIKYGYYDEDIVHRTIIKGLISSDKYNSTKASKLVWFQTILRNIFLLDKSLDYNDWKRSINPIHLPDHVDTLGREKELEQDDELNYAPNITDEMERVHKIIYNGDFIILPYLMDGKTIPEVKKIIKMNVYDFRDLLFDEQRRAKEILKPGDRVGFKPISCKQCGKDIPRPLGLKPYKICSKLCHNRYYRNRNINNGKNKEK